MLLLLSVSLVQLHGGDVQAVSTHQRTLAIDTLFGYRMATLTGTYASSMAGRACGIAPLGNDGRVMRFFRQSQAIGVRATSRSPNPTLKNQNSVGHPHLL